MSIRQPHDRDGSPAYQTQIIYALNNGRVLWATREANEALAIVECIETGRLPIIDIRPYGPAAGPLFNAYDDELNEAEKARRDAGPDASLQSPSQDRAAELAAAPRHYQPKHAAGTWHVPSSSERSFGYAVSIEPDTVNGGRYLKCTCPSWPFQRGKGQDCKHIRELAIKLGGTL